MERRAQFSRRTDLARQAGENRLGFPTGISMEACQLAISLILTRWLTQPGNSKFARCEFPFGGPHLVEGTPASPACVST